MAAFALRSRVLLALAVMTAPALAEKPRRIVSVNPCIDAVLVELVPPARIAAISHYSHDPQAASAPVAKTRHLRAIGGTAEEVIALKPDLVLAGEHLSPATRAALHRAGLELATFGVPATIAESRRQMHDIARAVGEPARGAALIARVDAGLAATRWSGPLIPALIWQGNGLVPGKGTLAGELLRHGGFRNASADYGLAQWDIAPLEYLVARPPRVIFTSPADPSAEGTRASASARLGRRALARLDPWTMTVPFPDRLLYCAGPNLVEASARIAAARRMAERRR